MNHNYNESQNLSQQSNQFQQSTYSIISEDLEEELIEIIKEYQHNQQDQILLELSKQNTVKEIEEKFRNSSINLTYVFPRKSSVHQNDKKEECIQAISNSNENNNFNNQHKKQIQENVSTQNNKQQFEKNSLQNDQINIYNSDEDDSFQLLSECKYYDLNSQNIDKFNKNQNKRRSYDQQNSLCVNIVQQGTSINNTQFNGILEQQDNLGLKQLGDNIQNVSQQKQQKQFIKQITNKQQVTQQQYIIDLNQQHNIQNLNCDNLILDNNKLQNQHKNQLQYKTNLQFQVNSVADNQLHEANRQKMEVNNLQKMIYLNLNNKDKNTYQKVSKDSQSNNVQENQRYNNQTNTNPDSIKNEVQIENTNIKNNYSFKNKQAMLNNLISNTNQSQIQIKNIKESIHNSKKHNHLNQNYKNQIDQQNKEVKINQQMSSNNNGDSIPLVINYKKENKNQNSQKEGLEIKDNFIQNDEIIKKLQILNDDQSKEGQMELKMLSIDDKQNKINKQTLHKLAFNEFFATEGEVVENSPSKQFYNNTSQSINTKTRKLKQSSLHQQKEQKTTSNLQKQLSININVSNPHITNSNTFKVQDQNELQQVICKTQCSQSSQERMNFSSNNKDEQKNLIKKQILNNSNQFHQSLQTQQQPEYTQIDLNDKQTIYNFPNKLAKQNVNNQLYANQLNQQQNEQAQNLNRILNFAQSTTHSNKKQFQFRQEGNILSKSIQFLSNAQNSSIDNNQNPQSNINNVQNFKIVNKSYDSSNQENRLAFKRTNQIDEQVQGQMIGNKIKQNQSINQTFHNISNENNQQDTNQSKSNANNKNLNTSISQSKVNSLNENQFHEFTPTSSQDNQINKKNKTSIRKLRQKIYIDSSFNEISDLITKNNQESQFTKVTDPSPYMQAPKHIRNTTLNSYYLKPQTTKNSNQRQSSDHMQRSNIINRVFNEKSEERIKAASISQYANGGSGIANINNQVQPEARNVKNDRFSQSNVTNLRRSLKVQSCKNNPQKNNSLHEQFKNTYQSSQQNNQNSMVLNPSSIIFQQDEKLKSQQKVTDKLDHSKQLNNPMNDYKNNSDQKKDSQTSLNQQSQNDINNQQRKELQSNKSQFEKLNINDDKIDYSKIYRYLKTNKSDEKQDTSYQTKQNQFQSNKTEKHLLNNTTNQIFQSSQNIVNNDFKQKIINGITQKTQTEKKIQNHESPQIKYNQSNRINNQLQYQLNHIEERLFQGQKSRSEENRVNILSAQLENNVNENKKRIISMYKNTHLGKSLTSTQPISTETFSNENLQIQQQAEQQTNIAIKSNKNHQLSLDFQQELYDNFNNLKTTGVLMTEPSSLKNSYNGQSKILDPYSNSTKVKTQSSFLKSNNFNQCDSQKLCNEDISQNSQIKQQPSAYNKSEQLNQILVQHTQKEVVGLKQQQKQYLQNKLKNDKESNNSIQFKINSSIQNINKQNETPLKNQLSNQQIKNQPDKPQNEVNKNSQQIKQPIQKQLGIDKMCQINGEDIKKDFEKLSNYNSPAGVDNLSHYIKNVLQKTIAHENKNSQTLEQTQHSSQKKGLDTVNSLYIGNQQKMTGQNGGIGYLYGKLTTSNTQSNESNKSPMKLNFMNQINTNQHENSQIQQSQPVRYQLGVALQKKKIYQLYKQLGGSSQSKTNTSTHQ